MKKLGIVLVIVLAMFAFAWAETGAFQAKVPYWQFVQIPMVNPDPNTVIVSPWIRAYYKRPGYCPIDGTKGIPVSGPVVYHEDGSKTTWSFTVFGYQVYRCPNDGNLFTTTERGDQTGGNNVIIK